MTKKFVAIAGLLALATQLNTYAQVGTLIKAPGPDDPIPPRYIYVVASDGKLLLYIDNSQDTTDASGKVTTTPNWIATSVQTPPVPGWDKTGTKWTDFTTVTAGGDGVIYAVDHGGNLFYFRLIDPARGDAANAGKTLFWSKDTPKIIGGKGWSPGIVGFSRFGADASGTLIRAIWSSTTGSYYKHGWLAGGQVQADYTKWTNAGDGIKGDFHAPRQPGSYSNYIEGGNGLTYAFDSTLNINRFRIRPQGTWVDPAGAPIGTGWNFPMVTAEPGEYLAEGYVSTEQPVVPTSNWKIAPMSVLPGDKVKVRVSTFSPSYTVRLLRLQRQTASDSSDPKTAVGLIDGVVYSTAVTVRTNATDPSDQNFKKAEDFTMHYAGANWPSDGADVQLLATAPSGIYAAEITTPSGGRYLAPFVVRPAPVPAAQKKPIAVIANVNTWNAYNHWGGGSRYYDWTNPLIENTAGQKSIDLSFERPFDEAPPHDEAVDAIGLNSRDPRVYNHLVRSEVWMTSWLDSLAAKNSSYAYDVLSDIDLDFGLVSLSGYKAVIVDTHPEYWTDRMLDALQGYIDAGGHFIYAAGNGLFQRVTVTSEGKLMSRNGVGSNCLSASTECEDREFFRYPTQEYPAGRSERAIIGSAYEPANSLRAIFSLAYYGSRSVSPDTMSAPFTPTAQFSLFPSAPGQLKPGPLGDTRGLNGDLKAAGWEVSQWAVDCRFFVGQVCSASHANTVGQSVANAFGPSGADIVAVDKAGAQQKGWVLSIGSIPFTGVLAVDSGVQKFMQNALDAANNGAALK